MHAALAEHRRLIEVISTGDPDAAEQVARDHIRRLRDSLAAAQDQQADHPESIENTSDAENTSDIENTSGKETDNR